MNLELSQIRQWLGLPAGGAQGEASGYSIDSRTIAAGDLFFAIRGVRQDGHAYVQDALDRGAVAAVVEASYAGANSEALLPVEDPAAALRELAAQARRHWNRTVIAITGSSGKTTTKDIIAELLLSFLPAAKSEGNLNNEYGLPLSLLRIPSGAEVAVVEIGINHPGEMRPLAQIAGPNVSVVTNVGAAHVGNFASIDEIASEKRGLVEVLGPGGTAVLNADDPRVREFAAVHSGPTITFGIEERADIRGSGIKDYGAGRLEFRANRRLMRPRMLHGRHNVYNVLAALAALQVLGITVPLAQESVVRLQASSMRGRVMLAGNITVIDDCYNSNPPAVIAMLDTLRNTLASRHIAVLGEMRELGRESAKLHRQVGQELRPRRIDRLIAVGGDAVRIAETARIPSSFCKTPEQAGRLLVREVRDSDAVLLKASRGVGLERARDILLRALKWPGLVDGKVVEHT